MCGQRVHYAHALIIGPLIIAAAYYDAKWLLYAIGGTAIGAHLFLERDSLRLGGGGTTFAQLPRWAAGPSCMGGCRR